MPPMLKPVETKPNTLPNEPGRRHRAHDHVARRLDDAVEEAAQRHHADQRRRPDVHPGHQDAMVEVQAKPMAASARAAACGRRGCRRAARPRRSSAGSPTGRRWRSRPACRGSRPAPTTEKVWMPPSAMASRRRKQVAQDRRRQQQVEPDLVAPLDCLHRLARGRVAGRCRPRPPAVRRRGQPGGDRKAPRQPQRRRRTAHGRRHARAEVAGEGVDREGPADLLAVDGGRQDRIVGGVVDRVGKPKQRVGEDEEPVARERAAAAMRGGADQQPAVSISRGPTRSTRKPAGVCSSAERR